MKRTASHPGRYDGPGVAPGVLLGAGLAVLAGVFSLGLALGATSATDASALSIAGLASVALAALALLASKRRGADPTPPQERSLPEAPPSPPGGLDAMATAVAHGVRNPLAAAKGHAQLLVEHLAAQGLTREADKAGRVVYALERIDSVTGELLDFVRAEEITPLPIDPRAPLETALARELDDEERQSVTLDVAQAPTRWALDAKALERALRALLRNARQASPHDAALEVRVVREHDALCYEVRDHGDGFDDAHASELFKPFFTTRAQGTGLGLALACRVIEAHGGVIDARNHPEGGAVFRVRLPRARQAREAPEARPAREDHEA